MTELCAADTGEPDTRGYILHRIVRNVATFYGLTIDQITGPARRADIAHTRHVGMFLARESDLSLMAIAAAFGRKEHTSIRYGARKIAAAAQAKPRVADELRQLRLLIGIGEG